MKLLASKILKIMEEIQHIPKRGYNKFHNYPYVLEADVKSKLSTLCLKHRVVIFTSTISGSTKSQAIGEKGQLLTGTEMEYTIVDVDSGELKTVIVSGAGTDSGDKGIYKAMTGAYKYFALNTFMISTGDDPEHDDSYTTEKTNPYQKYERKLTQEAKSSGLKNNSKPTEAIVPNSPEELRGKIIDLLMEICGPDAKKIQDTLYKVSFFKSKNGKEYFVKDVNEISFDVKEGKKQSQAQVIYRNLKQLAEDLGRGPLDVDQRTDGDLPL